MKSCVRIGAFLLGACLAGVPPAMAQTRAPTVEQLQAELERRDAIIADLLQRVQALEQRIGTSGAAAPARVAPPPPSRARSEAEEAAEEALLERALERSLVLAGGALLPRGQREIEPSLAYDFIQRSGLAFLGNGAVSRNFRRENYAAALTFRAGLPWSSQVDLSVPYAYQRVDSVVEGVSQRFSDSGLGDLQVALTHQFVNNRDARVAVLGGVGWVHSRSSESLRPLALGLPDFASGAAVGSGHDALVARLAASKRIDPLVFVGSLSHTWNRADDVAGANVKIGPANGASLRAILAASPDVSLRAGLSFTRTGNARLNGVILPGTRTTATVLELGTSVVLRHNMLLDVLVGVGLTAESPDFTLGVSLPIRF